MSKVVPFRRRDNRDRLLLDIDDHQAEKAPTEKRAVADLSVPEIANILVFKLTERNKKRGWL